MSAREDILSAVRAALSTTDEAPPHDPAYLRAGALSRDAVVQRFLDRLADYDVHVTTLERESWIAAAVSARLAAHGVNRIAAPEDLPHAWRPEGVEVLNERTLGPTGLDAVPACLTGCACAVAETGTVVLDGGASQGRRVLTLLPNHQLCIVFADQLVGTVPEAVRRLALAVDERRPLTFFSGPSATADIEFDRVVGVHGPRILDVIFVKELRRHSNIYKAIGGEA